MSFFGKRKSLIFLTALGISGVFLFSRINVKNALALHDAASYAKPINGTLTSENWNDLFKDFVNTWTTATMAGPLGIGVSTAPAAGLNVNGPIQGSSLFSLGSVGIGIASPISSRVQLYGNNTFDTALRFTNTGTNGGDYFILSSNSGWDAGGNKLLIGQGVPSSVNTKLVLTSDGNFGIATTSPAAKLGIASSTSRVINVGGGRIGGLDFTPINDDEAVSLNYLRSNYIPVGSTPGGIGAGTVGQTLRHNGTSWIASSLLYNNGTNIGIGTTNPQEKLHILGGVVDANQPSSITNSVNDPHTALFINNTYSAANGKYGIQFGNYQQYGFAGIYSQLTSTSGATMGDLTFDLKNGVNDTTLTERMRITSNGNVGIGTNAPNRKLTVSGGLAAVNGYNLSEAGTDSLIVNGDFEMNSTDGWSKTAGAWAVVTDAYSGKYALQFTGDSGNFLSDDYIPVDPTKDIMQLEAWVKKSVAGTTPGTLYFGYIAYNSNKSAITTAPCGTYCYFAASGYTIPADGTWHKISATTVGEGTSYPNFPVGTRYIRVLGLMNYAASSNSVTILDHVTVKRLIKGPLIAGENFSTTNKIDRNQYSTLYTTNANHLIIETPASGNVGIGTVTPVAKLGIGGSGRVIDIGGGRIGGMDYTPLNDDEAVPLKYLKNNYTASSTTAASTFWGGSLSSNVYNVNTGNVGIGTTAPGSVFTVQKNNAGGRGGEISIVNYAANTVGNEAALNFGLESSTYDANNGNAQIKARLSGLSGASTDMIFSLWSGGSFNEYMRILSNGNVGIGTNNPTTKLMVSNGTVNAQINPYNNIAYFGSTNNYPVALSVNGVERMRINSDGNIGIGTTNPQAKLDLSGDFYSYGVRVERAKWGAGSGSAGKWYRVGFMSPSGNNYDTRMYKFTVNCVFPNKNKFVAEANISYRGGLLTTESEAWQYKVSGVATELKLQQLANNNFELYVYSPYGYAYCSNMVEYHGENTSDLVILDTTATEVADSNQGTAVPKTDNWYYATGNVGIGTTTPSTKLSIYSPSAGSRVINVGGGAVSGLELTPLNNDEAASKYYVDHNFAPLGSGVGSAFVQGGNSFGTTATLGTNDNQGINFETNNAARITISPSGNVGIGITNPDDKLYVNGDAHISGNAYSSKVVVNPTSGPGWYRISSVSGNGGGTIYFSAWEDNRHQKLEFQYNIRSYVSSSADVGSLTVTRSMNYNAGPISQIRIGADSVPGNYNAYLDIYINTATTPLPFTIYGTNGAQLTAAVYNPATPTYSKTIDLATNYWGIHTTETAVIGGNALISANAGIGTTTPSQKLSVVGNAIFGGINNPSIFFNDSTGSSNDGGIKYFDNNLAYIWGGGIKSYFDSNNGLSFGDWGAGTGTNASAIDARIYGVLSGTANNYRELAFRTGGAERLRIGETGNVGIGTTTPSTKLSIYSPSAGSRVINVGGGAVSGLELTPLNNDEAASKYYVDHNFAPIGAAGNVFGTGTTGYLSRWTDAHTLANSLIYDNGTNVGIGTTSPTEKLEIVGKLKIGNNTVSGENMTFDGSTAGGMRVTNPYGYVNITPLNNGWAHMYTDRSNFIFNKSVYLHSGKLASYSTSDLYFSSGGSRIDMLINNTTGNVAIGTTTASTKLYVNGGTGNSINVNGGYVMGLNSTPVNADQAVPLGYLQANYAPTSTIAANSFWSGSLTGNVYNANTGNIGIGTTAPYDKLEVAGAIAATGSFGGNNNQGPATLMYYSTTGGYGGIQAVDWGANYKNLILNSFGGNVGIGTTNPNGLLEINGTGSANSMFRLITTGGGGFTLGAEDNTANPVWRIETNSSENFKFRIGGTDTMTLTPGFVGVGMTNPRTKAHIWTGEVSGGQQESLRLEGNWVSNPSGPLLRFTNQHDSGTNPNSGEYNLAGIQGVDDTGNWGGSLAFFTTPSGTAGGGNLAERMRITNNGNIGIGTTGPNSKLEVFGGAVNSGNSDIFTINTNSVSTGYYGSLVFRQSPSNIGARITSGNAGSYKGFLAFETSRQAAAGLVTSEAMRIDGAGNVGIGTNSPTSTLQVYGSGDVINVSLRSIGGLDLTPTEDRQAVPLGYLKANYGASTLWGGTTSGNVWSLNSGNVGIGTTSPQAKLHVVGSVRIGEQTRTNWPSDAPIYQMTLYGTAGDIPFRTASTSPMTMNQVFGPFGYANPSCDSSHAKWYRLYAEYVDSIQSGGQSPMIRIDFSSGTDRDFTMPLTWGSVPSYRTYLSAPFQETNTNHANIQTWVSGTAGPYVEVRKVELWAYCL